MGPYARRRRPCAHVAQDVVAMLTLEFMLLGLGPANNFGKASPLYLSRSHPEPLVALVAHFCSPFSCPVPVCPVLPRAGIETDTIFSSTPSHAPRRFARHTDTIKTCSRREADVHVCRSSGWVRNVWGCLDGCFHGLCSGPDGVSGPPVAEARSLPLPFPPGGTRSPPQLAVTICPPLKEVWIWGSTRRGLLATSTHGGLADRPTCPMVDNPEVEVGCRQGNHGRHRLRWEEPYLKFAGDSWWDSVGSWRSLKIAGAMRLEECGGDVTPATPAPHRTMANFPC